jgi:hypothetical protein
VVAEGAEHCDLLSRNLDLIKYWTYKIVELSE